MKPEERKLDDVIFNREKSARFMKELCNFVSLAIINEIECGFCKHKNKAKKDWVLRFGKDVCEECGEELPLNKIYGGPTKDYIDFVLKDEELIPEKCDKPLQKKRSGFVQEDIQKSIDPYIKIDPNIPDPIKDGLDRYIKDLEKRKEKDSFKRKSIADEAEEADKKDKFHRGWGDFK